MPQIREWLQIIRDTPTLTDVDKCVAIRHLKAVFVDHLDGRNFGSVLGFFQWGRQPQGSAFWQKLHAKTREYLRTRTTNATTTVTNFTATVW